jgi:hypothetical protein
LKKQKKINPRKLQPQSGVRYDQNWLPLFGRVFQSGPRSETRREFIEEVKTQKTIHKPVADVSTVAVTNANLSDDEEETGWQKEKEKIMEKYNKRKRT